MDVIVAANGYFVFMSALLPVILIHIVCGLLALYVGFILFVKPKHSPSHKRLGYVYVVSLTLVDLTGLSMYAIKDSGINAFHFLAIGNLIALYGGLFAMIVKRPIKRWYRFHYYMLAWSYVGLVTATVVEIAVKTVQQPSIAMIGLTCVIAVGCGGIWIEFKTRNMGNVLAESLSFNAKTQRRRAARFGAFF